MAITGHLKIDDIPGESRSADHEDEIDIRSIEWRVAQDTGAQVGSGRTQARAVVSPITLGKFYDASSPYLSLACMQGKSFDEVVISLRKDSGDAHLDYLVITLTNVVVSSYGLEDAERGEVCDQISLSFEKVKILYTVQADDHSAGDEHEIEYDVVAGV